MLILLLKCETETQYYETMQALQSQVQASVQVPSAFGLKTSNATPDCPPLNSKVLVTGIKDLSAKLHC